MIAFAEYLLKVTLCSALLTGYYWFALRNKLFHAWNRFYLLAAVVIAIGLPLVKITYLQEEQQKIQPAYQVLQTLTTDEVWFEGAAKTATIKQSFFTIENISIGVYLIVSFITLIVLLIAIIRIIRLIKKYQHWKINNLVFVDTDARGTPFSFLRFVFWNRGIDFNSEQGQQIFAHELVHVKQKHSWDKLFINTVLIVFWSNPIFWLIRKELTMIHEFIADQQSVKDHDTASFAAMILATAFPGYNMPLSNPFFYSPIKRRLQMLTKLQNPQIGYISRLLLLPLLTFLIVAFAVKIKEKDAPSNIPRLEKSLTVVIDAGHGLRNGIPHGAKGLNGITEDEISLAITKKIGELNKDEKLKLIFTRPDENFVENRERLKIAEENKADLLISIHESYAPKMKKGNGYVENPANGVEAYIASDGTVNLSDSRELGSAILNEMKNVMTIREPGIKQRQTGIYLIGAVPCPAVLLECGFVSNSKDIALLTNEKNQEKIAVAVLKGIVNYARNNNQSQQQPGSEEINRTDTIPEKKAEAPLTKNETNADFTGGLKEWNKYVESFIEKHISTLEKDPKSVNNSCMLQFTVQQDGSITDIKVITNTESELAKISVELLKNSPKWQPAKENGVPIATVQKRSVNFFDKYGRERMKDMTKTSEQKEKGLASFAEKHGLHILNGKVITKEEMITFLKQNKEHKNWQISSMDGLGGRNRFGEKGSNGVFEVTTKEIKPTVAVAAENMNILFADIENPMKIAVSDIPKNGLSVTLSQGKIEQRGDKFIISDLKPGELIVKVTYYYNSDKPKTEEVKYKVVASAQEIKFN